MIERIRFGYRWGAFALALALLLTGPPVRSQTPSSAAKGAKAGEVAVKGLRVFSCGHSFHFFMPPILDDMAKGAGIKGHTLVGQSKIGGSFVYQHWDVPEEKNLAKKALRAGNVDVLTLSPKFPLDDGIEKFAKLALEHNPKVRITIQQSWVPFDLDLTSAKEKPKKVDRDAATGAQLRKLHEAYFKEMDEYTRKMNKTLGKEALFIVPVGDALIALREKIIAKEAPGLKSQEDLFVDALGHGKAPLRVLVAYCHFAVIYQRSPVGLPIPAALGDAKNEKLNRLLQELAWDAVTHNPQSGVKAEKQ